MEYLKKLAKESLKECFEQLDISKKERAAFKLFLLLGLY